MILGPVRTGLLDLDIPGTEEGQRTRSDLPSVVLRLILGANLPDLDVLRWPRLMSDIPPYAF